MSNQLYDYLDAHGDNPFAEWSRKQQKPQRAKLNARVDWLAVHGEDLFPEVLTNTHISGIRKLRIKGQVQLRPLLCRGPFGNDEYTFLMGAKEVGDEWVPIDAPETADSRRSVLYCDDKRRIDHEIVK